MSSPLLQQNGDISKESLRKIIRQDEKELVSAEDSLEKLMVSLPVDGNIMVKSLRDTIGQDKKAKVPAKDTLKKVRVLLVLDYPSSPDPN